MIQLTREQAIAFCENKCYDGMTSRQIAEFQMEQDRLCVPFDVFHKTIEEALGRPVYVKGPNPDIKGMRKKQNSEMQKRAAPLCIDHIALTIVSMQEAMKANANNTATEGDW